MLIKDTESGRNLRFLLGLVASLIAVIGLIFTAYSVFHEKRPNLEFEIISESDLINLEQPVPNLSIIYEDENISERNLNLSILSVKITNVGDADILPIHYDSSDTLGIRINNGNIIEARLVSSNSDYLQSQLNPVLISPEMIQFDKVIIERGRYFNIDIVFLHDRTLAPELEFIGKIAGIESVSPKTTLEARGEYSFWQTVIDGSLLVHFLRSVVFPIILIIVIALIVSGVEKISDYVKASDIRNRNAQISKVMKMHNYSDDNPLFSEIADLYIYGGDSALNLFIKTIGNFEHLSSILNKHFALKEKEEQIQQIETEIEEISKKYQPELPDGIKHIGGKKVASFVRFGPAFYPYKGRFRVSFFESSIAELYDNNAILFDDDSQKVMGIKMELEVIAKDIKDSLN